MAAAGAARGLGGWMTACAALCLPALAALPQVVDRPADDVLIFSFDLDHVTLGDSLHGFKAGDGFLVPLGELCRELELGVQVDPVLGTADGFIIEESRRFRLDLEAGTAVVAGTIQAVDPAQVERHRDDLYVDTRLIARWFPLDLKVDFHRLSVVASAREPLPIEQRWEREALAPGQVQKRKVRAFDLVEMPHGAAEIPSVDESLQLSGRSGASGEPPFRIQSSTTATGDLLRMDGLFYALLDSHSGLRESWLTLGRQDARAGLLGPLRATRFAGGAILDPGLAMVTVPQPGSGVIFTNIPLDRASSLDFHSFRGSLAQGWQVELYRDRALLGFQGSRADGQYEFLDIPLVFGRNDFVLVFYGPQGQRRKESFTFNTSEKQVPPGAFEYQALALNPGLAGKRIHAQARYGLDEHLDVSFAAARATLDEVVHDYAQAGLDGFWRLGTASLGLAADTGGGSIVEASARSSLGWVDLTLRRDQLRGGFRSEAFRPTLGLIQDRTRVLLATNQRAFRGRSTLVLDLGASQDRLAGGGFQDQFHGGVSLDAWGANLSGELSRARDNAAGVSSAETLGTLLVSRNLGPVGLRLQSSGHFSGSPRLDLISLQGDLPLGPSNTFRATINLNELTRSRELQAGWEKRGGAVGLGAALGYSSATRLSADITLRIGLSREPRHGTLHTQGESGLSAQGAVSLQVFLDRKETGIMAPDDPPMEGVSFLVNGETRTGTTDARGVLFLTGLPANQEVTIAVNPGSLKDPLMRPVRPGFRIIPRAGHVEQLAVPVVIHGEMTGTASVRKDGEDRPLAGLKLELVDAGDRVVKSIRTEFDGYFILKDLPPGTYRLRVPREEAGRRGLKPPQPRELRFEPEGTSLDGVVLVLEPAAAGQAP